MNIQEIHHKYVVLAIVKVSMSPAVTPALRVMDRAAVLAEIEELSRLKSPQNQRLFEEDATIVLVGCRGSGKRSLGFIGATHLGRRLITEENYFEQVTGLSRKVFLSRYGNQEFKKKNVRVLQKMLKENSSHCIIECGMGSLAKEAQATLREYCRTHPVIHIIRNFRRIRRLLGLSEEEAKRLEYADSIHRSCSNFEYYNMHDPSCEEASSDLSQDRANPNYSFGLKDAKKDFSTFLDFITGRGAGNAAVESPFSIAAVPPERRQYTAALQLQLSDLLRSRIDLSELESGGGDVVELVIDTWAPSVLSVIGKQVSVIRREIEAPIILSVGDFSKTSTAHDYTPGAVIDGSIQCTPEIATVLLEQGLRLAVDYISINLGYDMRYSERLLRESGRTKTIAHYLEVNHNYGWRDTRRMEQYRLARGMGFDIIRLLQTSSSREDNEEITGFRKEVESSPTPGPPLISYNVGSGGTPSLIWNKVFSPVTHPQLRPKTDKAYLPSSQECLRTLFMTSMFDPLNFYISGGMVSYSLSPAMHGAAYQVCGMSHTYRINQTSSVEDLVRLTQDPNFGGSAINQPFRLQIMPHLTTLSYHARAIGAVNTIVPLRAVPDGTPQFLISQAAERKRAGPMKGMYGDNTDWIGIVTSIRRNSSPRNIVQPSRTTGLIIGAGGMARSAIYALIRLGCRKIFIYNRTVAHAEAVAAHFNAWTHPLSSNGPILNVLTNAEQSWPERSAQPTLIVSCLPAHSVGDNPLPHFEMPEQWLRSPTGGVVMEVRSFSSVFRRSLLCGTY